MNVFETLYIDRTHRYGVTGGFWWRFGRKRRGARPEALTGGVFLGYSFHI